MQLAVLLDTRVNKYLRNQDNPVIHYGFRGVKAVGLDDVATLDVKQYPVLMVLFGESYPMAYFDGLHSYVARGGTVVFPEGGILLYYDLNLDNNELKGVGKTYQGNMRRKEVLMRGPVITVDVSKGSCHYQPFLENGKPIRKAKVLHDTVEGFSDLEETIEIVKEKGVVETVPVVFEATGVYHRCL